VDVDLVNVLCSVRDKRGGLIGNLEKDDFQILEDGKDQPIRHFARETDLPLTIGMLIDVSKSQEFLIEEERRAGALFFEKVLRPKDVAFLISFGAEAELLQDHTGSAKLLRNALGELRLSAAMPPIAQGPIPQRGPVKGTILYDAVYLAADEKLKGEVGRKVLILITDGMDYGSRYKIQDAVHAAHRSDAIIYSIYYVDQRAYGFGASDGSLKRLSEETGGRVFHADRRHTLDSIFKEIQDEMRSQYSIGFASGNPARDGGFRKLDIRAKNKELRVQARKGYFAVKG